MGPESNQRIVRTKLQIVTASSRVSAVLAHPDVGGVGGLRAAVLLAHGAGADMDHPFMVAVHEGLAARGAVVLRFNFRYTEEGRGAPDRPPVLLDTMRAARDTLLARPEAKGLPLVLAGKSMGGRMASHLAALGEPADALVFFGYPLHPPKQPEKMRDAHLGDVSCPMLFLEGTRDPLCDLALLRPVLERLGDHATLHVIEDGDHSFHVRKSSGRGDAEALEEAIDAAAAWIARVTKDGARSSPAVTSPGRAPAADASRPKRAASSSTARAGTTKRAGPRAPRT
jgi:predicted alpha/beta-hydrolase family hydrolase